MKTTLQHPRSEGLRFRDRVLIAAGLFLVMLAVGVQLAHGADVMTVPAAAPSTAAYHFSSHPMISGTVVTVNDHQMVVDTDQGQRVTLELDTRTMAPRDLGPGMVMRAEFLALEDCRFYARRILPIRDGVSTDRRQAYANTRDREVVARSGSALAGGPGGSESLDRAASPTSPPQTTGGTVMTSSPATAAHQFSAHPMLSGRVISVNDHRVVVETDQGQYVSLVMDSRTMVPAEIAPGSVMRAEFTQMKDGRYYAQRISRISDGAADREQAYAHTRDSELMIAQNIPDCGFVSTAVPSTATSAVVPRVAMTDGVDAPRAAEPAVDRPETLPQTASHQPLMLVLGLLALASAGVVTHRSNQGAKI